MEATRSLGAERHYFKNTTFFPPGDTAPFSRVLGNALPSTLLLSLPTSYLRPVPPHPPISLPAPLCSLPSERPQTPNSGSYAPEKKTQGQTVGSQRRKTQLHLPLLKKSSPNFRASPQAPEDSPEEASSRLPSHPSQRAVRVLKPTPTRRGRVLLTPSLPLKRGLQNCTWGKRSKKGKGDHHGPLPIFSGIQKGLTEGERLVPFKRQLGWQKWEGSTAGSDSPR